MIRLVEQGIHVTPAYWRAQTVHESRFDFASIERREGVILKGSAARMGTYVHLLLGGVILWTRTPAFTARSSTRPPVRVRWRTLIRDEWFVVLVRSWFSGLEFYRSGTGATRRIPLTKAEAGRLWKRAEMITDAYLASLLITTQRITSGAFLPDGRRFKRQDLLEAELRAQALKVAPLRETTDRSRVYGFASYDSEEAALRGERAWPPAVATMLDTDAGMRLAFDAINPNAPLTHYPELSKISADAWLATEASRQFNSSVQLTALKDRRQQGLQYTAIRDHVTCDECIALDGTTLPKDDPFWTFNLPPLHPHCRCNVVPMTLEEVDTEGGWTPPDRLNEIDPMTLAPGYGGASITPEWLPAASRASSPSRVAEPVATDSVRSAALRSRQEANAARDEARSAIARKKKRRPPVQA